MQHDDGVYVGHMLDLCRRVVEKTTGKTREDFDTDEIKFPRLASDDSHTRIGCGRAWIEMDCRRSKDSIIRAVKKGRFWNCYQRG